MAAKPALPPARGSPLMLLCVSVQALCLSGQEGIGSQGQCCACLEGSCTSQPYQNPTHSVSMVSCLQAAAARGWGSVSFGGSRKRAGRHHHGLLVSSWHHPQDRPGDLQEARRLVRTPDVSARSPQANNQPPGCHWLSSDQISVFEFYKTGS